MDIEFESIEELYRRLKPALNTKVIDLHKNGFSYIHEDDVWNYLKEIKWKNSSNLRLYQMVDDVLNTEDVIVDNYVKDKMNLNTRKVYFAVED